MRQIDKSINLGNFHVSNTKLLIFQKGFSKSKKHIFSPSDHPYTGSLCTPQMASLHDFITSDVQLHSTHTMIKHPLFSTNKEATESTETITVLVESTVTQKQPRKSHLDLGAFK